jgi:regulator of sigma E protease
MSWLLTASVALLVLGVLIFVHELGHFLVAKWCGVGVVKFAVGFGPAILKFRRDETDYQLGCIPLGGFVRMVGDMPDMITGQQDTDAAVRNGIPVDAAPNEALEAAFRDETRWFIRKNTWQKSAIVFAGPLFNFVFAIFVVGMTIIFYGQTDTSARIGKVMENSPAASAGLQVDDVIEKINDKPIAGWIEMAETIYEGDGGAIELSVRRGAETLALSTTPQQKEFETGPNTKKKVYVIGIEPGLVFPGIARSFLRGATWTAETTMLTYAGLWSILTGQISPKEGIAGPVKIYQAAVIHAERGLRDLLFFIAFVSVSLAAINLLPIPILDGGHLMFFLIEGLLGPISIRKKEMAQQFGLLLILMLMVFAIHNDLTSDPLPKAPENKIEWKK